MGVEWGPDAEEVKAEERRKGLREWARREAKREKRDEAKERKGWSAWRSC